MANKKNPTMIEIPYATALAVRNSLFGKEGKDYSIIIDDLGGDLIAEIMVGALVTGKAPKADPRPRRDGDCWKRKFVRYSVLKDEVQYQVERLDYGMWILESEIHKCTLQEWDNMPLWDDPVDTYQLEA